MRISDWSSDVCSSDLSEQFALFPPRPIARREIDRTGAPTPHDHLPGQLSRDERAHGLSHGKLLCCFRMRERGGGRRWNPRGMGQRMKRLPVHDGVDNLATSIPFYSTLFRATPPLLNLDYSKRMLKTPPR